MIVSSGVRTFVASSLPPIPVSYTAKSHFCCLKYTAAMANMTSKNEGCSMNCPFTVSNADTKSSSDIFVPFICILSFMDTRWGDMNNPTLYPRAASICARARHVLPLPLVPATCIAGTAFSGFPKRHKSLERFSLPIFCANSGIPNI